MQNCSKVFQNYLIMFNRLLPRPFCSCVFSVVSSVRQAVRKTTQDLCRTGSGRSATAGRHLPGGAVRSADYEISIEVPEQQLRRNSISFDQIAGAIRKSSISLHGGTSAPRARKFASAPWGASIPAPILPKSLSWPHIIGIIV